MTHTELERLGWKTLVVDKNSFVSKREYSDSQWLEVFYCKEKNFIHFMDAVKGDKGEVRRYTKFQGNYDGFDFWSE